MGRARRKGFIITWWLGDHDPPHVHVRTQKGKRLGRINLETMKGMEGWTPSTQLVRVIKELQEEGRI